MIVRVIRNVVGLLLFPLTVATVCHAEPQATARTKPNILVIFGDDIGVSNISAYSDGLMGYKTPNIDRIAAEGTMFTDANDP